MTSNLQKFINLQNANIIDVVSEITHYIPKQPRIEKFDLVWEKTSRKLLTGDKKIYNAFISSHLCGISHVRKYLTKVSPYNKHRPKEGDKISFGYGHATKCSKYLTKALIVFLKNYYGERKAQKMIQNELWRVQV